MSKPPKPQLNYLPMPEAKIATASVQLGLFDTQPAEMINRACERSVPEAADRADIQRRYEAVLTVESRLTASGRNT